MFYDRTTTCIQHWTQSSFCRLTSVKLNYLENIKYSLHPVSTLHSLHLSADDGAARLLQLLLLAAGQVPGRQEVGGGGGGYWLVVVGVVPASLTISPWPGASTFAWLVSIVFSLNLTPATRWIKIGIWLLLPGYITHTTNWKRYTTRKIVSYVILSLYFHDDLAVL